jgi:hypothetical protein
MVRRSGKLFAVIALAAIAGCNVVTGLGELEFSRDAAEPSGTGGDTSGAGGAGGAGGGGAGEPQPRGMSFGDTAEDYPAALLAAPGGDVVLAGTFAGTVDFGMGPVQSGNFQADGFVARFDPTGALRFAVPFDSGGYDCAFDSAVDAQGQVFTITGVGDQYSCRASVQFGSFSSGNGSPYISSYSLRRLSADGAPAPAIALCEPCAQYAVGLMAVATDAAGAVYVAGSFQAESTILGTPRTPVGYEDVLVIKLDATGAPVWVRSFGALDSQGNATDLIIDAQGGVVIAGKYYGTLPLGMTTLQSMDSFATFVARLDAGSGAPTWARSFTSVTSLAPPRLAAASDGILMTGDFVSTANFGGDPLVNPDPELYYSDAYLAKLDLAGDHVWSMRFGDRPGPLYDSQGGTALTVDANGDIFLAGVFGGSIQLGDQIFEAGGYRDGFLAKLDATGALLSARHVRGSTNNMQVDVMVAPAPGSAVMAGAYLGDIDYGGPEPLVSKAQSAQLLDIYYVDLPLP